MNSTNYKGIPALSPKVVHELLFEVGRNWYTDSGVAMELGSWLGGSAVPLLEGLVEAGYNRKFYAFDKWKATKEQVKNAKDQNVNIKVGQDLLPMFLSNVYKVYENISPFKGRIEESIKSYHGDPIEICIFDAPKKDPVFTECIKALLPYFIPQVTVLGLLDYYFYKGRSAKKFRAPVRFMKEYSSYFEKFAEWPGKCDCVFFKYTKKLVL